MTGVIQRTVWIVVCMFERKQKDKHQGVRALVGYMYVVPSFTYTAVWWMRSHSPMDLDSLSIWDKKASRSRDVKLSE